MFDKFLTALRIRFMSDEELKKYISEITDENTIRFLSSIHVKNLKIKEELAKNENCPLDILQQFLDKNNKENIRVEAIKNKNVPYSIVSQYLDDDNPKVSESAKLSCILNISQNKIEYI